MCIQLRHAINHQLIFHAHTEIPALTIPGEFIQHVIITQRMNCPGMVILVYPLSYTLDLIIKRFMSSVAANLQKAHQQMKGMERMNSSAQHPWKRSLIMGWKRADKTKKNEGAHRQIL